MAESITWAELLDAVRVLNNSYTKEEYLSTCVNGDGNWAPSESGCCYDCAEKAVIAWAEYMKEQKKPKPRGKKKNVSK